ncbi:hypothetical protein JHD46_07850 [Sulfurimonas sp. SAG-AH-194-C20]|nr:hypothetical protein [Sulfurimonas sp. SAG-AH-194-C20]MDF1879546.1 hypothetical protein [Sulfurimonas sp. SAG-AH-194-C20]
MIQIVGDLRAKGLTLYADKELNVEIENNSIYNLVQNREFTAYISVDKVFDGNREVGKMFILEEYYKYFQLDLAQEVDGLYFRNYDNIESLSITYEFDTDKFLISVFRELRKYSAYKVLTLLTKGSPFFSEGAIFNDVKVYLDAETKSRFLSKDDDEERYEPPIPIGFWEDSIPVAYYTFYRDWFEDPLDRDKVSIWKQYWVNDNDVNRAWSKVASKSGFSGDSVGANYFFNIYPSHKAVLDGRTVMGGFELNQQEYRLVKDEILDRFKEWYGTNSTHLYATSQFLFIADRLTTDGFTGIGKVETKRIYERDKHILERLLGPISCARFDPDSGRCLLYEYGSIFSSDMATDPEIIEKIEAGTLTSIGIDDIAFTYKIIYADIDTKTNDLIQSEATRDRLRYKNPEPIECMYAAELFDGKIGGQTIYNKGLGNEYEYHEIFRDFLAKRNLSVSDFLDYFEKEKLNIINLLQQTNYSRKNIDIRGFCEFYNRETRSPFDGIHVYIPAIAREEGTLVEVRKKKVIYSFDGSFTEEDVPVVYLDTDDFKLPFDKDEYVDSIVSVVPNIIMSKFTRIKVHAKFKEELSTIEDTFIRFGASDLTYMNVREFAL